MKYILISLLLAGCSDHYKCIDGHLYFNVDAFNASDIYSKSDTACVEIKDNNETNTKAN